MKKSLLERAGLEQPKRKSEKRSGSPSFDPADFLLQDDGELQ